jgi:hypothetical protein
MKDATIDLINAHLRYHVAAKAFEEQTGCGVGSICDYIQIGSRNARGLVESLGVDVTEMKRRDGYWEFRFTYQAVNFLWLEKIEEEK